MNTAEVEWGDDDDSFSSIQGIARIPLPGKSCGVVLFQLCVCVCVCVWSSDLLLLLLLLLLEILASIEPQGLISWNFHLLNQAAWSLRKKVPKAKQKVPRQGLQFNSQITPGLCQNRVDLVPCQDKRDLTNTQGFHWKIAPCMLQA